MQVAKKTDQPLTSLKFRCHIVFRETFAGFKRPVLSSTDLLHFAFSAPVKNSWYFEGTLGEIRLACLNLYGVDSRVESRSQNYFKCKVSASKLRSTMTKTMSMTKLTWESRSPILFFKSNVSAPKRLKWPETVKFWDKNWNAKILQEVTAMLFMKKNLI